MLRAAPCGCPGGHARHVPVHRRGSWLRFTALPLACPGQTPDDGAIKWWIGNAAEDGKLATVFARLKVRAQPLASAAAQLHRRGGGPGRQSRQLSCCSRPRRAQRFGLRIRPVRSSQPSLPLLPCTQVPAPDGSGALDDHGVVSPAPDMHLTKACGGQRALNTAGLQQREGGGWGAGKVVPSEGCRCAGCAGPPPLCVCPNVLTPRLALPGLRMQHAFIVPLRDDAGNLWPGVEIHDCGYKVRQQWCTRVGRRSRQRAHARRLQQTATNSIASALHHSSLPLALCTGARLALHIVARALWWPIIPPPTPNPQPPGRPQRRG